MENYEFASCSDGQITARNSEGTRVVTPKDRELIEFFIKEIEKRYPEAFGRLCNLYESSKPNKAYWQYLIMKRFVRCNMGADDLLTLDIEDGIMNLEFISCPLRGECEHENVICCPKVGTGLTRAQKDVAKLYAKGKGPEEIASILCKSPKTISNHLREIKKILKLKRVRDIITYNLVYKI